MPMNHTNGLEKCEAKRVKYAEKRTRLGKIDRFVVGQHPSCQLDFFSFPKRIKRRNPKRVSKDQEDDGCIKQAFD